MSTEYRCDNCGLPIDTTRSASYRIGPFVQRHNDPDPEFLDDIDLCADCAGHAKLLIQDGKGVESMDGSALRMLILAALQVEANRTFQAAAPNLVVVLRRILEIAGDPDDDTLDYQTHGKAFRTIGLLARDALRNPNMPSNLCNR